ncbi:MAG: GNAT family N-acetyltransferase [Nitriliruptoraceae bacterium]
MPAADHAADLEVRYLDGSECLDDVLALLDRAETAAGVPLLDESEHERLRALATEGQRSSAWGSVLLRRDGRALAYGGVAVTDDGRAQGDLALDRSVADVEVVTATGLAALHDLAAARGASAVQVWMRAAGAAEIAAGQQAGFVLERRLGVLGRDLPATDVPPAAAEALARLEAGGTRVRSFEPGGDDVEVVAVLAAAYEGTGDGGWDLARFEDRQRLPWFRAEDLLVAEDEDGHLAGLHWLKRRDARSGEVYNLAVHPRAQGRSVGPALLYAGLEHLADIGCSEAILWVDRDNDRAVRLYERYGFTTRWDDVAFGREVTSTST